MSAGHIILGLVTLFSLLIMSLTDHAQLANQTALAEDQARWRTEEVIDQCVINPPPGTDCTSLTEACLAPTNVLQVTVVRHWEPNIWKGLTPTFVMHRLSLDSLAGFGLDTGAFRTC